MKVLYYSNHPNQTLEKELNAKKVDLSYLLKESDFVSLHVPLNKKTHHAEHTHLVDRPTAQR